MTEPLSSDTVEVVVERKPSCIVELAVTASPSLISKAKEMAYKVVGKHVSVPGFRKGKAPKNLLDAKFPERIDEQLRKSLADLAFQEAERLCNIPPLSRETRISFDMKSLSPEAASLSFSFETAPELPDIDPATITLSPVPPEVVDEAKVDETILQIRRFFATFKPVTERPAQEGDAVRVSVEIIENDPPVKALEGARFEVSKEHMADWMRELVIGMSTGEAREGISTPDADATEEQKKEAAEPKKVRLTLDAIEEIVLPEVSDELAGQLGAKDVSDMRTKLFSLLTKRAEDEAASAEREAVTEQLLSQSSFDLPQSVVERELRYRLEQLSHDPSFQKSFAAMDEAARQAEIEGLRQQGERAVRLFYLSQKIVDDNKIEIDPSDIPTEATSPLEAMFMPPKPKGDEETQRALAISRLMLTKAQDFIRERASKSS
jgi:trigger factor